MRSRRFSQRKQVNDRKVRWRIRRSVKRNTPAQCDPVKVASTGDPQLRSRSGGSKHETQKRQSFPGSALGRMGVGPCLVLFERCGCGLPMSATVATATTVETTTTARCATMEATADCY